MSCTTDTCRDKTLARLPAIVKVNRKRTNEAAEVALALATANARNFVAKYCARIAVVQRFTSRTPIFPFRWKNFVFPFFYFSSWILLSLLLNRTLSFLSSFFFFIFISSFPVEYPRFIAFPWTFINESLLRSTSSFFRRYRHDKRGIHSNRSN